MAVSNRWQAGQGASQARAAASSEAGPQLFTQLTIGRGWPPGTYQDWLAAILAATLLDTP